MAEERKASPDVVTTEQGLDKVPALPRQPGTALSLLETEIARFLASPKESVLCIRGKWGVGETYAWDQNLKVNKDKVANARYAGLDNLDAVKNSIFENTIPVSSIGQEPSVETYLTNLQNSEFKALFADATRTGWTWGRKSIEALAQLIPHGKDALLGIKQPSFLTVKNQIICIDDLERKGKNLRLIDVLGLASFLKERRKCKIVLILNEEELDEESETLAGVKAGFLMNQISVPPLNECIKNTTTVR